MNAFLNEVRNTYHNLTVNPNFYKCLHVVLGNESCDLDSAIAALVYGFALHHEAIQGYCSKSAVLPLLNIPRDDLVLKTEVTYFLRSNSIDMDLVPTRGFRGLLNLDRIHDAGCLKLTLVDHHHLAPGDVMLKSSVVEVIDHRPQDPKWLWQDLSKVMLKNVGSCCSLIALKINQDNPHLLTQEISKLLLGPILIDTVNLLESAGRTFPLDKAMVALLESNSPVDRGLLYKNLLQAKSDINQLSTSQVFRKDLKYIAGVPIIGVPTFISELVNRSDFESSLAEFKECSVIILMGVKATEDSIARDLAIYVKDDVIGPGLIERLLNSTEPDFDLENVLNINIKSLRLFKQGNVKATRKQIAPIVSDFITKLNDSSQ